MDTILYCWVNYLMILLVNFEFYNHVWLNVRCTKRKINFDCVFGGSQLHFYTIFCYSYLNIN